jgi:hypothetical protein
MIFDRSALFRRAIGELPRDDISTSQFENFAGIMSLE